MDVPFGDLLRRARRTASLSQQELAGRAGLTVNGVSQLERGVRTRPYPHTVRALADALSLVGDERDRFVAAAPPRGVSPPPATTAPPPTPPTFVGRDAELAALLAALSRGRLVTLTGPGGVGKTTLATAAAVQVAASGTQQVVTVPLADVDDPQVALLSVASHAGVHEGGAGDVRDQLRTALGDGPRLLVLDNLEQLPALTVDVAALLADLPELRILATSRQPLRSRLEIEVPVRPLPLADAVELLVDRATAAPAPIDRADPATTGALRTICSRVDGLPLAVELAAAWLRTLSPSELAARLEDALPLLEDGPADLPARHRSLRDTIAWSERLLDDEQREVFRSLSVLPAAWDLATAAAVADRPELEVMRVVAGLLERNLVVRAGADVDGHTRYRMLETVRAYGREQLDGGGAQRARLAEVVVEFVEHAGIGTYGSEQAVWLTRIEDRLPDVRATLRWAVTEGQPELAARAYEPLIWSWYLRHPTEGERWGRDVLSVSDRLDPARCARVQATYALAVYARGETGESLSAARRALHLADAATDDEALARALSVLAHAATNVGDRNLVAECARRVRTIGDEVPFAAVARASVRLAEARGEIAAGAFEAARALLELADGELDAAAMPWLRSLWLNIAVGADLRAGRDGVAERLERSLRISSELGDAPATLYAVTLLAVDTANRGAFDDAARVLGAAEAHAARTGQRIADPGTERLVAELGRHLGAHLGDARFAEALAEGHTLSPQEALLTAGRTPSA